MKKTLKYLLPLSLAGALALSVGIPASLRVSADEAQGFQPNVYTSDYDTRSDLSKAVTTLGDEIGAEGVTMLKNEDGALPLKDGAKITILGKNSNKSGLAGDLAVAGFQVNNDLVNFYNDNARSGSGVDLANYGNASASGFPTGETPISSYTDALKGTFKTYNDAALVVIYRVMREGMDAPRTMKWDGKNYVGWDNEADQLVPGARAMDDHYLQLDQNETDLLQMASENFEKVVVLLATPSTFETGFLDDPGHYAYHENIKAALFITNNVRTGPVAGILKGTINPSGHTVDTWVRDFKLDPTWQNFGNYLMEQGSANKGNQYTNLPSAKGEGTGGGGHKNNYAVYSEGIYIGYRYWETRTLSEGSSAYTSAGENEKETYLDAQSGGSAGKSKDYIHCTSTKSWDSWYDAHVVYPFGYGLSYTTFEQSIVSSEPAGNAALTADGTITLNVKVKNTGTVAGKDVVQVYYTAPYKAGGIEKAHVALAAFAKTKLLEPQEEQTLALTFKVRDMASYDYSDANKNGFKGYELDDGEYTVRLMKNAHEEIASVKYSVASNIQYKTDSATGNEVENRFDSVSNYLTDELHQKYLSRNDWEGTWPVFNKRLTASQAVIDELSEWLVVDGVQTRASDKDQGQPYYSDQMPTFGAKNGIVLSQLHGKDYEDPMWDDYLDEFTADQLREIVTNGNYCSGKDWPELGVRKMTNADGPGGLGTNNAQDPHYGFTAILLRASTWNVELAYRLGKLVGEDALWGFTDAIGGWYAPSVNIERNQFCGRNGEYYGEEGLLGGTYAAYEIKGAQEKGLPVYVKHFAFNNSETNRCGLMTWLNEQSMREIYLKAFEICVKEGKALGIMSGLNRVGATWTGGSYELLTEILRNEWGFRGSVVTDSYLGDASNLSNADQMIRAGGNLALGYSSLMYNLGTPTTMSCLREAAHGILYAQAHSNALNTIPQGEHYPVQTYSGGMLERGTVGIPYSQSVANAKLSDVLYPNVPDTEIVYTVSQDSALPAGLTLSPQGMLTGTPTEELNNYRFKIDATYAGYTRTAEFTISVVGAGGAIVYEMDTDLGTLYMGEAATVDVGKATVVKPDADGEPLPTCTYALANGSLLPAGLSMSSDGKITGTPAAPCENFSFSVTASARGFNSRTLTFNINVHYKMTFSGSTLAVGKLGHSYMEKLPAATLTQGKATYALKEGSKLPSGLSLTAGGYVTGTPREAVTDYTFTVVATAPYTDPIEAEFKITIGLSFNENTLRDGKVGESYTARVDTAQGAGDIKYSLKEGSALPDGLTLSEDGVISGTPQKAGDFTLTVVASADGKIGDEITLTLHIAEGKTSGGGCGGVIGAGGAGVFLALVTAAGVAIAVKRKKKD